MHNVTINGTYYPEVFGRTFPGPIWKQIMESALKNVPESQFPAIDPSVVRGVTVYVPDVTGLEPAAAAARLESMGLTPIISSKRVASAIPEGLVAYTDPRTGSSVSSGADCDDLRQHRGPAAAEGEATETVADTPTPTPKPTIGPSP